VSGGGGAGEPNEDDHTDGDDDSLALSPPHPPLLAVAGLPGVVLYWSAVLHEDSTGGDGALMRRGWRERGGVNGAEEGEYAAEEQRRAGVRRGVGSLPPPPHLRLCLPENKTAVWIDSPAAPHRRRTALCRSLAAFEVLARGFHGGR